jgi:hypothetical protein
MTATEIRDLITLYLQDASSITAAELKSIENALVDYMEATQIQADNLADTIVSVIPKKISIDTWSVDRNYTVSTGLDASKTIMGVIVMLECKAANNGFLIGDIVTAPTPYLVDTGRTLAQGIGVQFINGANIRVIVNDEIVVMNNYNAAGGATAGNVSITGSATANWKINLYFNVI